MGEQHEAGTCKELVETRIEVARLEENVKIIPDIKNSVDTLIEKLNGQTSFIAGVSATVSAVVTMVGLFLSWKGGK